MSASHGLTPADIQQSLEGTLRAAVKGDDDAVDAAMEPLFREDVCRWDWFSWTIGMIAVATKGVPHGPGQTAIPFAMVKENGEMKAIPVDELPDLPEMRGAVTVLRLTAMYLNDERDEARALWDRLVSDDLARVEAQEALGPIEGDSEPSAIAAAMLAALDAAVTRTRALLGSLQ